MSLPIDELPSAFHDGELNSAERAVVEQRLAESTEARRELSEIRQVSSLLKDLPGGRLPTEFPQQALQAIEREMLIPSQRSEFSTSLADQSSNREVRSRRLIGVAAVLTSAAGLLLLMRVLDEQPGHDRPVRHVAEARALNSETAPAAGALDTSVGSRDAPGGFGGGGSEVMVADAATTISRRSSAADKPSSSSVVEKNLPFSAATQPLGVTSPEVDGLYFDQSALRDAQIGDVVRAMRTEGTEVAVVWLTVVDHQKGLAGLQLLLANNHIARTDALKKSDAVETSDKSEKSKEVTGQMHAVFVESNPEQLAAALQKLRNEDFWQSLEVDQPIELAQLDDVRNGRLPAEYKLAASALKGRSADREEAVKELGGLSGAKKQSRAAAPSAKEPATADRAKSASESKDSSAKQETFNVPLEALVQNQNLNQANQQSRNRGLARNAFPKSNSDQKSADKAAVDHRPMQVLFVVVDQSRTGKSQASPANSAKPTAPPAKARTEPAKPGDKDGAA